MPKKLTNLRVTRVALVDAGANPDADILIYKAASHEYEDRGDGMCETCGMSESEHQMAKAAEPPNDKEAAPVADEMQKNLDEVTADRDALRAELDALAEISNEDLAALRGFELAKSEETDEINKADLPESVRKALDEADALKTRVEKMEADNRRSDFIRKARDEYGDLAPAEDFGPVLEEIDRLAPDAAKSLDTLLKAVAARAETSALFKELGQSGESSADPVADKVAEIMKADPNKSRADATSEAMRDPELQKAWAQSAK